MTGRALAVRLAGAAALAVLAGCGGSSGSADGPDVAATTEGPLGERDDTVVALSAATGAVGGSWDGDVLVLDFDTGSSEDPGAMVNCSAVNRLIAEHQRAVLAYPDGDLDCEDARLG